MDQDRTRRVLSDGLITFLSRPFHLREKPEIPQKQIQQTLSMFQQAVPIRPESRSTTDSDRFRRALSIPHLIYQIRVYHQWER